MTPSRRLFAWVLVLAVAITFAAGLACGFVNWDDEANFVDNPHFRASFAAAAGWAFRSVLIGVYQPLAWIFFTLQHALFGLEPAGYHAVSIALHAANAALAYAAALRFASPAAAFLAAGWFGLHPLRVESVVWVSAQPYLWSALFSLLCVHFWWRDRWWISLGFFAAALACKAAAVPLPFVLWGLRREARIWPFIALSAIGAGVAVYAAGPHIASPNETARQALHTIGFFVDKTAWPRDLSAYYPIPASLPWSVAGVSALFLVAKFPVLGVPFAMLVPHFAARVGHVLTADRYTYFAAIALTPILAAGLERARARVPARWQAGGAIGVACLLLCLGGLAAGRTRIWQDSESLWRSALPRESIRPEHAVPHHNFALALAKKQKNREAETHLLLALRLRPDFAEAYASLGFVRLVLRDFVGAREALERAVALDPRLPGVEHNLKVAVQLVREAQGVPGG